MVQIVLTCPADPVDVAEVLAIGVHKTVVRKYLQRLHAFFQHPPVDKIVGVEWKNEPTSSFSNSSISSCRYAGVLLPYQTHISRRVAFDQFVNQFASVIHASVVNEDHFHV